MVEEGELYAEKSVKPGEKPEVVMNYNAGDYFGELALLNEIPRQASVVCKVEKNNCFYKFLKFLMDFDIFWGKHIFYIIID